MLLTKKFRFEAAHRLVKGYKGKCAHLHGHSWNGHIAVEIEGLDEFDMAIDYKTLGEFTKQIEELYDHATITCYDDIELNLFLTANQQKAVILKNNPTCETLCQEILDGLSVFLHKTPARLRVVRRSVTIEETCTTSCTCQI